MEMIMGSVECVIGTDSRSITVEAATTATVPTIAAAVWNLRDVEVTSTPANAVASWLANDAIGAVAQVTLWPEPPLPGPFPQPEGE